MGEFNVIIVGGGLAGPLLASGLLQSGVKVDVYEKLAGDAKRDGYQIRVAQPCLRAFRENLSADQCQRINAKLGHFDTNKETTPIWYDHKLNTLLHMGRINEQYHGSAPMDRVILRNIIIEQPVEKGIMHFGKSFSGYEIISDQGRERVRVSFEDGSSADCDLLIGADGSHSKINVNLGLNNIQPVPVINFICKARLSKEKLAALPAPALRAPMLCFSHRKTYFAVAYIPKPTETNPEIGKGEAATISSDDDEEEAATFTFSFLHLKEDCPKNIKEWDNASKWKFLEESVSDWDDAFRQVIRVMKSENLYVFEPRASTRPALDWRSKAQKPKNPSIAHPRVWLMGDAMHVMLPNRGMGGNQAMLDTTVIGPLITQLNEAAKTRGSPSTSEIAAALRVYEQEMIPRAFYWVEASGGTSPVPFDTNTFLGRCTAWSMKLTLDIRDIWLAILRVVRLKR